MNEELLPSPAQTAVGEAAAALVRLARQNGLILTIETQAVEPLAMGNYRMQITVRTSHESYRSEA